MTENLHETITDGSVETTQTKVVIVESPNKIKTIKRILGEDYTIVATVGNFYDLDKTGEGNLGIDVENDFAATYHVTKPAVVSKLKQAVKDAEEVFLATDPDREGEAISSHVCKVLDLDVTKTKRLEFNEITVMGINEALQHPRLLDLNLVSSQETRRMVDRIMGFRLSGLTQKNLSAPSAGRVQSAALRMIVDRKKEIDLFVPQAYYTLDLDVEVSGKKYKAKLVKIGDKDGRFESMQEAQAALASVPHTLAIDDVVIERKSIRSLPAFTTSQLQQTAAILLNFPIKQTMEVAHELYEGITLEKGSVGLITYTRTDSVRVSPMFINQTKKFIEEEFGANFVGVAKNYSSSGQDAHEGIRPTYVTRTPKEVAPYLSPKQLKLYDLIWSRGVASIMADKVVNSGKATFHLNNLQFEIDSYELVEPGFTKIYGKYERSIVYTDPMVITKGETVLIHQGNIESNLTRGPQPFNEARIIKELDEKGIGRPSTYVQTIQKLITAGYVRNIKGVLVPTETGILTSDELVRFFPTLINETYTAQMESDLDNIATGKTEKLKVLRHFYNDFQPLFTTAMQSMKKVELKVMGICPECGSNLVERNGKYGKFTACSNYPACRYIVKVEREVITTGEVCPECKEGELLIRTGRYGKFKACNRYPKCRYIVNINDDGTVKESKSVATTKTKKKPAAKKKTTTKKKPSTSKKAKVTEA